MVIKVDYIDVGAYDTVETHEYPRAASWFMDESTTCIYVQDDQDGEERVAEYNTEKVVRVYYDHAEAPKKDVGNEDNEDKEEKPA